MALQTIKMRQLGAKGVISDASPFETNIDSWSDALNIRFSNGRAQKSRGYSPIFYNNREEALELEGVQQIPMHLIKPPMSEEWFYCTKNAIWHTNGWDHTLYTPDFLGDTAIEVPYDDPWNSTSISSSVIVSSQSLPYPLAIGDGDNFFKPLPNWGPWRPGIMRTFKNFVFSLGQGEEYPQRVRWSNITPPMALPPDWGWTITEDSSTGLPVQGDFIDGSAGGYNDLSFAKGRIVEGLALRDSFFIYTNNEVIACDYVGSNDIFRFRALFDDGGALNPGCVAAFDNKHFVVGANDVYIHNGSTKESVINNKVREKLLSKLTEDSFISIKVIPYLNENEIWVIYAGNDALGLPDAITKEATKAAVYNYVDGTWSFLEIPGTLDVHLGYVPFFDENGTNIKFWNNIPSDYDWDTATEAWNLASGAQNLEEHSLLCASSDGSFYVLDSGDYFTTLGKEKDVSTNRYPLLKESILSTLSKDYIDLDEVTDTTLYKTVLNIWPQVLGEGELSIQIGGAEVPGGDITWGESMPYSCSLDRKVDFRENHRYLCLRIQGRGVGNWTLSGFDATIRVGGRR